MTAKSAYLVTDAGSDRTFACAPNEPILLAALRAGVHLSYECGTGTCGNCQAELINGSVESRWHSAPGLKGRGGSTVLLCQAEPRSECTILPRSQADAQRVERLPVPKKCSAEVRGVTPLTDEIALVSIQLERAVPYLPGQYFLFDVPGVHGYRAYSVATAFEGTADVEFIVRRTQGGAASPKLCQPAMVGKSLALYGPMGLAFLDEELDRDIACLAGGSGLAPILSIARAATASGLIKRRRLSIVFGVRRKADLFCMDILEDLAKLNSGAIEVTVALSEPDDAGGACAEVGMVHEVARRRIPRLAEREVFMAGPPAMIDAALRMLITAKVRRKQIHFDKF